MALYQDLKDEWFRQQGGVTQFSCLSADQQSQHPLAGNIDDDDILNKISFILTEIKEGKKPRLATALSACALLPPSDCYFLLDKISATGFYDEASIFSAMNTLDQDDQIRLSNRLAYLTKIDKTNSAFLSSHSLDIELQLKN